MAYETELLFVGLALSLMPLLAQTVALTNTSNPGLDDPDGADFVSGDVFQVLITGAAANQTVAVLQTNNGVQQTQNPWPMGSTNSSGYFSLSASEADVNSEIEYTQQWYVGGVAVGPLLDFEVIYAPAAAYVLSYPLASPDCGSSDSYGLLIDVEYQILNSSGHAVSTQGAILMTPTETAQFYQYGVLASTYTGDIMPLWVEYLR